MDDIRQWHLMFAVLAAATIHTVAVTLYLALARPPSAPIVPPIVFLQSPPLPAVILPPEPQTPPDADIPPIAAPAFDPDLPSVTLRRAEELPEPPQPVTIIEPEPVPLPERQMNPEPLDLTQFEVLPPDEPVPIPTAKPAPPPGATAPVPPAAPLTRREAFAAANTSAPPSESTAAPSDGIRWPEKVEDLTPALKHRLLTEHYVDDKSNWEPWHRTRDDAWRRLNMGFVDQSAPPDFVDLEERLDLQPPDWDPHEGPLTVQELEETLAKLVASGLETILGRRVDRVSALTYAERQRLLKAYYKDDPRWAIGIVDPKAGPDHIDMDDNVANRPLIWDPHAGPLTVQELEATLEKLVALGTTPFIGRNVKSAKELSYGERQDILERYYGKDPRWQIGIIDPAAAPDLIDMWDRQDLTGGGADVEEETPLTVQEVEETLRKMLDRKLEQQKAPHASSPRKPEPATQQ